MDAIKLNGSPTHLPETIAPLEIADPDNMNEISVA